MVPKVARRRTRVSLRVAIAAVTALALLGPTGPTPGLAAGNAGLHLSKTVDPAQITVKPALRLTVGVDKASAIPGDTLTYTAVVTNAFSTFGVGGTFRAVALGNADATVAYYWDELESCSQGCGNSTDTGNPHWIAFAGSVAGQPGYLPVVKPDVATGLSLTAAGVPANGVTYPAIGDPILGTVIQPQSTATWNYQSSLIVTPSQIAFLSDPTKVQALRNVVHFEVTVRNSSAAEPYIDAELVTNPFQSKPNVGAVSNITVTFTFPDGTKTTVSSSQVAGLALLAPGGSITVTATFKVPVPAARASGETDSGYLARLVALEGSALTTTASASGTGLSGTVTATPTTVTTTAHLPIVTIMKSGPTELVAGNVEVNPLALQNIGGSPASGLVVRDSLPGGATGFVTGVPASLTVSQGASAQATFTVPASQTPGNLTDTAAVTWKDGNGNAYGVLTSSFTTNVKSSLANAKLTLAPTSAGPNPLGTSQTLTATLLDRTGTPIPNKAITFHITGANPGSGTVTTDANGKAVFTYIGANAGNDVAQATVSAPGVTLNSNTATISWGTLLQPIVTGLVQGNFFPNPNNSCTFDVGPGSTPSFGQTFPDILFNASSSVVPHDISTVNNFTRPFTDLTVDVNGNYNGQVIAQGNGQQAGTGSLVNFYGVFNGNFVVSQPGDLTFRILHDDGYIMGVGNGATRVNGDLEGNPPTTTPFNGLGVVAAWNTGSSGSSSSGPATVHFPAAGTYPYELDYTECGAGPLFLDLLTEQFVAQNNPLSIYVGYADGLRAGGSAFPFPWNGSPNVTFIGCTNCQFDAGALRFENSSASPITLDSVTVDLAANHFDIWPRGMVVPAGQILIMTMTVFDNFDTSDFSPTPCNVNDNVIPAVNVTINGTTTTYQDTKQVLNTGGFDLACLRNENLPWQRIAGSATPINIPLPPAISLNLTPFNVPGAIQGQSLALTVSAMDGAGNPIASLPISLQVFGANTQTLNATTGLNGLASFSYTGLATGTDSVQGSAFAGGARSISNQGAVTWSAPGGAAIPLAPAITNLSPADGAVVTKPVGITATVAPPAGQSITAWRVFYQALDPGPQVTIASGIGPPPATLATFDPTVLPNDTYGITVEATASNGAVQDVTTAVAVMGYLKPGRYVTTYQDLSVPVGGFQMEVRRTYDSIDKSAGDFGVGWKVSVANFRVAANRILGAGGWTQYNKSCTFGLCFTAFKNSAPRYVMVTFPDQHTEFFDFTPQGGTNLFWDCTPQFTARGSIGTTSTLKALDATSCSYNGDGNIYGASGPYSPKRFQLTTKDGRVLILDTTTGLISETDTTGNSLSVSAAGVRSTLGPASSPTPGPSITFTRDAQGRITDINGPVSGQHLHYSYAASGPNELQTYTDATGHTSTYSYDGATGNLALANDANNQPIETLRYDSSGRLISIANGSAPPTVITTSSNLQQQVFLDPSGNLTTVLTFDDTGDVIEEDQTFGGQPALQTLFTYDTAGRLTSVTDPMKHTTSATYDETNTSANGEPLTTTYAAGRSYSYQNYTSFGQPGTVLKPDGSVRVTYTYDATTGALTSSQQPGQNPITYQYYPDGLLQSITDPGGRTEQYTYDAQGHLRTAADSQGRSVTFQVDAGGNVTSVTDQMGNPTLYQYNGDGTLAKMTDGDLNSWQFFYDLRGRMNQIKDPFGQSTFYGFNSLGQLAQRTDRNGVVTAFTYDVDSNLTQVARPNNDVVNFTYDPLSRLIEADNSSSHIDRTYDGASRLISESSCANTGSPQTLCSAVPSSSQPSVTMAYSWLPDGLLQSVTSSDAGAIRYTYDGLGRLNSITDPALGKTGYGYDNLGRVSSITRPNGVNDLLGYNASGDLTSRDSYLNGILLARSDYAIDPFSGRRLSSTNMAGTNSYSYYNNGTLQSATHPAGSGIPNETYTYDAAGNRTSANGQTATFSGDRLQSDGQFNYRYDASGRLAAKTPVGGGAGKTYSWDAEGQLTSITYPNGSTSSYRYDPFGRRIASVDPGGETRYVWNSFAVHADYSSQNQLLASYVPGATFGAPLEQSSGSQTLYYLADGQNNPSALTNSSGQVVGSYSFNSFGVPQPGNASSNRYSYGGYQLDPASGLYYAGARYYDPTTGRFISEDPQAAVNPYPYAANDPIDLIDPLGQQALSEFVALIKRVALEAVTFLVRVGCGLLNLMALVGLIQFAFEGLSPYAKGVLGENWLGKATGGLGDTHGPIDTPGGTRIPDRTVRLPGLGDIFLESKNAAAIDARSIAQITDMTAEEPVVLLTRTSLRELPQALQRLAARGLLKWVKCFPA